MSFMWIRKSKRSTWKGWKVFCLNMKTNTLHSTMYVPEKTQKRVLSVSEWLEAKPALAYITDDWRTYVTGWTTFSKESDAKKVAADMNFECFGYTEGEHISTYNPKPDKIYVVRRVQTKSIQLKKKLKKKQKNVRTNLISM